MFEPATTGSGESTFETERSAVAAPADTAGGNSTPMRVNAKMIQRRDAFMVVPPPRPSCSAPSTYTLSSQATTCNWRTASGGSGAAAGPRPPPRIEPSPEDAGRVGQKNLGSGP